MAVSFYVVHDTRFKKKSNKYPIKLRVVLDRKPRNYQTIYELSIEDGNKLDASRVSSSLQTIRDKLKIIEATAQDFISKQEYFPFEDFEKDYILNNPLFRQRSSSIYLIVHCTNTVFLFSKKATLKQDGYWPFICITMDITNPKRFVFTS